MGYYPSKLLGERWLYLLPDDHVPPPTPGKQWLGDSAPRKQQARKTASKSWHCVITFLWPSRRFVVTIGSSVGIKIASESRKKCDSLHEADHLLFGGMGRDIDKVPEKSILPSLTNRTRIEDTDLAEGECAE